MDLALLKSVIFSICQLHSPNLSEVYKIDCIAFMASCTIKKNKIQDYNKCEKRWHEEVKKIANEK